MNQLENISVSESLSSITDNDRDGATEDVKNILGILKSKVKGRNKEIKYNDFNNHFKKINIDELKSKEIKKNDNSI